MGRAASRLQIRETASGVVIAVRVTPKSARDAIEGVEVFGEGTVLKARVRAAPDDGRANVALETLIAKWLDVPRMTVLIVKGGKSRIKHVAVDGNGVALSALIATRLAEL